jgi:hypothetical protein
MWMEDLCDWGSGMGGFGSMGKLEKGTGDTLHLWRGLDKGVEACSIGQLGKSVVARVSAMQHQTAFIVARGNLRHPTSEFPQINRPRLYELLFIPYIS